jgi:formate dehydrogenase subunit delta
MKAAILEDDPAALSPVARDAVQLLARGRKPAPQTHATEFNAVDEAGHSDAG